MLSQMNRLMSHAASHSTNFIISEKKTVFTPACGESSSGSDVFFDRLGEKNGVIAAGRQQRVKIPGILHFTYLV